MGKRTVALVLMLCLVVEIVVGQFPADNWRSCVNNCIHDCLRGKSDSIRAAAAAAAAARVCYTKCSNTCSRNYKPCSFFWCWNWE